MTTVHTEKGKTTMSEMIVKLNADRVKLKGCEYIRDLIRCIQCRYAQNKVCSHPNNNGCCIDDNHYCGYAEIKEDE